MVVPMVVLVVLMFWSRERHIPLLTSQALVENHSLTYIIQTNKGPIIGVFNQYAYYGKGQTVHSVNQFRHFGIIVDDSPSICPW
jgi:mannitol-specific phosphotransferase system IIBC component